MDHLPLPLSPAVPPLEIPLVADIIYNFGDFVDFPRRHGFVKDDEEYLNVFLPRDRVAAFLQPWLWFRVVAEFSISVISDPPFNSLCRIRWA